MGTSVDTSAARADSLHRWAVLVAALAFGCRGASGDGGTTGTTSTSTDSSASEESGESSGDGDGLPPAPTLVSPPDDATKVPIETALCWSAVQDPDGEALRYRVFVDDIELIPNEPGELEGYAGPCTGPLTFSHERDYAWKVRAFEVDDPTRNSAPSATWTFGTVDDGTSKLVFEDDFDEDLGWQVGGDATGGAWIRGAPVGTVHMGALAQPGRCARGDACFLTGQNPDGIADQQDVAGGATTLTSPAFDLEGAAAATVQLRRFFYKSQPGPGPSLAVELLVPDADEPGGYAVFGLEQLESASADVPDNRWTAREYAACGLPLAAGARLRVTATDAGAGILEAAIDSVRVRAHPQAAVCTGDVGGFCDPLAGDDGCGAELSCCPQGTTHDGVHRCAPLVAGLDWNDPPASPDDPGNGPLGCHAPDLVIDTTWIEPVLTDIMVSDATCELLEGCVGGTGWRTILRFTVATPNIGSRDLALGVAANNPDVFHYSACHDHYHFDDFAIYELRDQDGVVASGHKQAFCLLDTISWAWPNEVPHFDCANQGVSRGFSDFYESDLPCQWIDVTDVAPGDYTLRIELNPIAPDAAQPLIVERDNDNNVVELPVALP